MLIRQNELEGHVDRIENGWVFGWAWHSGNPDRPTEVDIYVNDEYQITTVANLYRSDLETAGKGNGRHLFEVELPERWRNGQPYRLNVRFSGTNLDLFGSPQSVSLDGKTAPARATAQTQGKSHLMGPTFRSRFGGLWADLSNAVDVSDGKATLGWISAEEAELLKHWVQHGFVILPRAVSHELINSLDADVEKIWNGNSTTRCFLEEQKEGAAIHPAGPKFKDKRVKLLDLYEHLESARQVVFNKAVLRFLSLLFERPILAFQSLYFRWGSRQAMHQDSAFVKVSSPMEFAASWIALEDIQPGSGELEYYKGSHKLDDYVFEGQHKWMPVKSPDHESFLESLHQRSQERGLERQSFLPKKGDVLLWSADLAHGGSMHVTEGLTRKSIVTHYCPSNCDPVYADRRGEKTSKMRYNDTAFYVSQGSRP